MKTSISHNSSLILWKKIDENRKTQACGMKYMPATAATVQSNQIGTAGLQDGTYLVEESF